MKEILGELQQSIQIVNHVMLFIDTHGDTFPVKKWDVFWDYFYLYDKTSSKKQLCTLLYNYSQKKIELYDLLVGMEGLMYRDITHEYIQLEEIEEIRKSLQIVSDKIVILKKEFAKISCYSGSFIFYKEIARAIEDFKINEVSLYYKIQQELDSIVSKWTTNHFQEMDSFRQTLKKEFPIL